MPVSVKVGLSGPFFTKDVQATMQTNVRAMMEGMAAEGERYAIAELQGGQSSRAPIYELRNRVSEHVHGRVHAISGKRWTYHAQISVNNAGFSKAEGISLMAAASEAESETHAFRRTASRLRASRAVNAAELTKGLN